MRFPIAGETWFEDWYQVDRGESHHGPQIHQGIDVFAPEGTPIVAPEGGQAIAGGPSEISGYWSTLKGRSGLRWFFAHLDGPGFTGRVSEGSVIGRVGRSGNATHTQPHTHIEIKDATGERINPFPLLKRLEATNMPAPVINEDNARAFYTLAGEAVHDWVTGVLDQIPPEMDADNRNRIALWRANTQQSWYQARNVWNQEGRQVEAARLMVSIANVTAHFDRSVVALAEQARAGWGGNFLRTVAATRDEFLRSVGALVDAAAAVPGQVLDVARASAGNAGLVIGGAVVLGGGFAIYRMTRRG